MQKKIKPQVLKGKGEKMNKEIDEKSLVVVNEKNILYKIKMFFVNLFNKKVTPVYDSQEKNITDNETSSNNIQKDSFIESLKNIEDEETKLLKIQKQYENEEIKEADLSVEQLNSLYTLYDRQIADLKKSNEIRKQRLLKYRRKLQIDG